MKLMGVGTLKYILVDQDNNEIDKYDNKALAQLIQRNHNNSGLMTLQMFQDLRRESNTSTTLSEPEMCISCQMKHECDNTPDFECPYSDI